VGRRGLQWSWRCRFTLPDVVTLRPEAAQARLDGFEVSSHVLDDVSAKRRRSQLLDLGAHGAKRCRLEHRHEPRERVCGFCVGRGEAVAVGSAVTCGTAVEPPEDESLEAAAGCDVASGAAGGMSTAGGVAAGGMTAASGAATGAAVGGMSATSAGALVVAERARSFIARTDQTISSKPTLPPARYMRASV
jgi:hypothetical protein